MEICFHLEIMNYKNSKGSKMMPMMDSKMKSVGKSKKKGAKAMAKGMKKAGK
jgi:hypothetical protein